MSRPDKCRFINVQPNVTVFKPGGIPARSLETVELQLDELEALRLSDLEGLYHEEAASQMGVSRATFGRIIERARRKVADTLINGKMIVIQGGNIRVSAMRNFECMDCGNRFQEPYGTGRPEECPSCGGENIYRIAEEHDKELSNKRKSMECKLVNSRSG